MEQELHVGVRLEIFFGKVSSRPWTTPIDSVSVGTNELIVDGAFYPTRGPRQSISLRKNSPAAWHG
jgi:hypothetical protein